jgi:hypothetical protein
MNLGGMLGVVIGNACPILAVAELVEVESTFSDVLPQ